MRERYTHPGQVEVCNSELRITIKVAWNGHRDVFIRVLHAACRLWIVRTTVEDAATQVLGRGATPPVAGNEANYEDNLLDTVGWWLYNESGRRSEWWDGEEP